MDDMACSVAELFSQAIFALILTFDL